MECGLQSERSIRTVMINTRIATVFEQVGSLLEHQEAPAHRVRAWRDGAQAIREHPREMSER